MELRDFDNEFWVFDCPYCGTSTIVHKREVNCIIFRCGVYKSTGQQINPHMPKVQCDQLVSTDAVYGCARPYRVLVSQKLVQKCDYI